MTAAKIGCEHQTGARLLLGDALRSLTAFVAGKTERRRAWHTKCCVAAAGHHWEPR